MTNHTHKILIASCWPHSGKKYEIWIDGKHVRSTNDYGDALAERECQFSDKEFAALPRLPNGDVDHLSTIFMWLSERQKGMLTNDDQTRLDDYEEEARILMSEAAAEFGV